MTQEEQIAPVSELLLYSTEDTQTHLQVRLSGSDVWLTQAQLAELYQTTPQNITLHLKAIYEELEITETATCKDYLQVRNEGGREVRRTLKHYSLAAILAVGYRVRSPRGTQFRQWATAQLSELIVKGFVMDDARLKDPGARDYFDELLARIREIRASEKRFYQKVRDLFALSTDYRDSEQQASRFFAEIQNKLLYAVTRKTAAELIVDRADASKPNMGLTTWDGSRVRKSDVIVAKNYLESAEIDELNRLVVIFLEQAELRVMQRKDLTLDYWRQNVDRLLEFNDRDVLKGAGSVAHESMKQLVRDEYDAYDAHRRRDEAAAADADDLRELEAVEKSLKRAIPKRAK